MDSGICPNLLRFTTYTCFRLSILYIKYFNENLFFPEFRFFTNSRHLSWEKTSEKRRLSHVKLNVGQQFRSPCKILKCTIFSPKNLARKERARWVTSRILHKIIIGTTYTWIGNSMMNVTFSETIVIEKTSELSDTFKLPQLEAACYFYSFLKISRLPCSLK